MAQPISSKRIEKALASLAEIPDPLERLGAIRRVHEALDQLAQEAADEARATGATWRRIGAVHGVSKQAAQQRFRRPAAPAARAVDDDAAEHGACEPG